MPLREGAKTEVPQEGDLGRAESREPLVPAQASDVTHAEDESRVVEGIAEAEAVIKQAGRKPSNVLEHKSIAGDTRRQARLEVENRSEKLGAQDLEEKITQALG